MKKLSELYYFIKEIRYNYKRDDGRLVLKEVTYLLVEAMPKESRNVKLSDEHSSFKWVHISEAGNLLRHPNQKLILKKAEDKLKK